MAYRVLAFVLAAQVLIQAMSISYALAGLGKWVADDGGVLNAQVIESESASFAGVGGFMVHGINGMMIIPILTLALLVVSFFVKSSTAVKQAAILLGLVVLQTALGIFSHSLPAAILLHALNAFAILAVAVMAGLQISKAGPAAASAQPRTDAMAGGGHA